MEKISEQDFELILNEAIQQLYIPHFMRLGMDASGQWKQTVEARGTAVWGQNYTEYLANGRPPNQDQDPEALKAWVGWAGSTFLKDWVQDKGLNISPYAVAWSVARKGTTWHQKGGSDLLTFLNSREFIEFLTNKLAIKYTEEIRRNLFISTKLAFES